MRFFVYTSKEIECDGYRKCNVALVLSSLIVCGGLYMLALALLDNQNKKQYKMYNRTNR